MKRILVNIALLLLVFEVASASTLYIAPDRELNGASPTVIGKDTNDGTLARPLKTFDKAWTLLYPGDTLILLDGIYLQTLAPNVRDGAANPQVTAGDNAVTGALDSRYPLDHPQRTVNYITVRAQTDGKAVIDGEFKRDTVLLGYYTQGWKGHYFIVEGLLARNSLSDVFFVMAHNVILRRNSGYNANTHRNAHVFTTWTDGSPGDPSNVLLEDNFAAGSGRKMFVAYASYVNVIFRRNAGLWTANLSDQECQNNWPNGDNIEIYNWSRPDVPLNALFENNIALGRQPTYGINLTPNPARTINNKLLGNISINGSRNVDGSSNVGSCGDYPLVCRDPLRKCTSDRTQSDWMIFGTGLSVGVYGRPYLKGNVLEDNLASGNYSLGFAAGGPEQGSDWCNGSETSGTYPCDRCNSTIVDPTCAIDAQGRVIGAGANRSAGNVLNRLTLSGNSVGFPPPFQGAGIEVQEKSLDRFRNYGSLGSLYIEGDTRYSNPAHGARLQYRYVNGALRDGTGGQPVQSLWPWPMEARIRAELADPANDIGIVNYSVTQRVCVDVLKPLGALPRDFNCQLGTVTPSQPPTPLPPRRLRAQ